MDYVLEASKRTVLAGVLQLSVELFACSWEEAKLQAERLSLNLSLLLFLPPTVPLSLPPLHLFLSLSLI